MLICPTVNLNDDKCVEWMYIGAQLRVLDPLTVKQKQTIQNSCPHCGRSSTDKFCRYDGTKMEPCEVFIDRQIINTRELAVALNTDIPVPQPHDSLRTMSPYHLPVFIDISEQCCELHEMRNGRPSMYFEPSKSLGLDRKKAIKQFKANHKVLITYLDNHNVQYVIEYGYTFGHSYNYGVG